LEITGGNAEGAENKAIAKKATRKLIEGKALKIDGGMRTQSADQKAGITGGNCGLCGSETT
jgi:hypothetical protein